MTFRHLRPSRVTYHLYAMLVLLGTTGCTEEPINRYTAPRPDGRKEEVVIPPNHPPMGGMAPNASDNNRILGAILLDAKTNYYIKLTGPTDTLEKFAGAFDQFVKSLKFTGKADNPLTWTVPEGWKPGKGNQFSKAAFALPVEGRAIEVTVSEAGGSLIDNLNRWRGQMGLDPILEAGLAQSTTPLEIDGRKGYRVDLKSEAKASAPTPPATTPAPTPPATGSKDEPARIYGVVIPYNQTTLYVKLMGPAEILEKNEAGFDQLIASLKFTNKPESPLSWTLPQGWTPGKGTAISLAAFALPNTPKPVEVTITPAGGSLLDNLNRWRTQLNLPILPESQLGEMSKEIQVDGCKAYRVSLKGTGGVSGMMVPPFQKK